EPEIFGGRPHRPDGSAVSAGAPGFSCARLQSWEALLLQGLAQLAEAPSANEANRTGGQPQLLRHGLVRTGWDLEEEHGNHATTSRRQRAYGFAEALFPLQLIEHLLGEIGAARLLRFQIDLVIKRGESVFLRAQALVVAGLHEPLGQSLGIAQLWQVREQIQGNGLKNVGGIVPRKSELDRNREDEVLVLIKQSRPCRLVPLTAFANQAVV